MTLFELLVPKIDPSAQVEFKHGTLLENFCRTKVLAITVILIDAVLAVVSFACYLLEVNRIFHFKAYLALYLLIIVVNALMLLLIRRAGSFTNASEKTLDRLNRLFYFYVLFMLCWGSVITLMDQMLYVQLTVFMINMIACSTLFYINTKAVVPLFLTSSGLLFFGLPFFQHISNVLIGHYVNLTIFIFISFLVSRVLFFHHCQSFNNKQLLKKAHEEHKRLSFTDELTGLPNRRSYTQYIEHNYIDSFKAGTPVAVIMTDIDFFKQYNDFYGHMDGDEILIKVANEISSITKNTDLFAARIGGEEFILIATGKTTAEMKKTAEVLRQKIFDLNIPHICTECGHLTVSAGIAEFDLRTEEDIYLCIRQADKALYFAKKSGRNRIEIYNDCIDESEC